MAEQFVVLTGTVLIQGKSPDGDSIRFLPQHPDTLKELTNGARVRPSPDGSVQLRLDAIDAPETHYAGQHQPLGTQARDELVSFAGFRDVTYNKSGTVTAATPNTIPAVIAAKLVELHGRPVCYLFINPTRGWDEGQTLPLSDEVLNDSVNAHMVSTGRAYTTLYTSTPLAQREYFTRLATTARGAAGSVWTADSSARFTSPITRRSARAANYCCPSSSAAAPTTSPRRARAAPPASWAGSPKPATPAPAKTMTCSSQARSTSSATSSPRMAPPSNSTPTC